MCSSEMIMMAASTALTAVGQYQNAQNEAKMSEYGAQVARNNALAAQQRAAYDAERQREKDKLAHSTWLNRKLNSGFTIGADTAEDSGSIMDLAVDDVTDREMDAGLILYDGALKQNSYLAQAEADRFGAAASALSGGLNVTNSLLSGGTKILGNMSDLGMFDSQTSGLDVSQMSSNKRQYNSPSKKY